MPITEQLLTAKSDAKTNYPSKLFFLGGLSFSLTLVCICIAWFPEDRFKAAIQIPRPVRQIAFIGTGIGGLLLGGTSYILFRMQDLSKNQTNQQSHQSSQGNSSQLAAVPSAHEHQSPSLDWTAQHTGGRLSDISDKAEDDLQNSDEGTLDSIIDNSNGTPAIDHEAIAINLDSQFDNLTRDHAHYPEEIHALGDATVSQNPDDVDIDSDLWDSLNIVKHQVSERPSHHNTEESLAPLTITTTEQPELDESVKPLNEFEQIIQLLSEPANHQIGIARLQELAVADSLAERSLTDLNLQGIQLASAILTKCDLCRSDLSEANLREIDLVEAIAEKANFSKADLVEANLQNSNLLGANLQNTTLIKANFFTAKLKQADLSHADLKSADLRDADLSETDMSSAVLEEANLQNTNLSEANLRSAVLTQANLANAKLRRTMLSQANLKNADLRGADLFESDLTGAILSAASLDGAKVTYAILAEADLENANLAEAQLNNSNLEGANLKGAHLIGASLVNTNFRRVNLENANLWKAFINPDTLKEAYLSGTTLPDGSITPVKSDSVSKMTE